MVNPLRTALEYVFSAFSGNSEKLWLESSASLHLAACHLDKLGLHERIKVVSRVIFREAKKRGYLIKRRVVLSIMEEFQYFNRLVIKPACAWGELVNLLAQILVFRAKARILRLKRARLEAVRRKLLLERRELIFQKSEMLSHDSSGTVLFNDLVNQNEGVK